MSPSLSVFPAVGATLLLATAILLDIRQDVRRLVRGRNVVLLGIFAWFLLEALTLSPGLRDYKQTEYNYGIFCVLVAMLCFLVGYHASLGCTWFGPAAERVALLDDPKLLWRVVLFCGVIGFAPIIYFSGMHISELLHGILGMRKTWGGVIGRSRYGGVREAILQLENFVTGAGAFAAILLIQRRSTALQRLVCAAVVAWPILRGYGSGTRNALLASVLPVLAIAYYRASPTTQRRLLFLGLCATPLVYGLMAAIVASRNSGELSWSARTRVNYVGNEMFQELVYMTSKVPDPVPYQMGQSYAVQACAPIPRFLWPGKPSLETGIMLARMRGEVDRRTGDAYYQRSPGLLGEMYLNFGLAGIIVLSMLGGWFVRGWDKIPSRYEFSLPTMVFYGMGLVVLFFLGRSFTVAIFYPMLFFVGAVYLLSWQGRRAEQTAHGEPSSAMRATSAISFSSESR